MADEDPVVTLKTEFSMDNLDKVKHTRKETDADGVESSISVALPILNSTSTDAALLHLVVLYNHARTTLRWNTGDVLNTKFQSSLTGTRLDEWIDIVTAAQDQDREATRGCRRAQAARTEGDTMDIRGTSEGQTTNTLMITQ